MNGSNPNAADALSDAAPLGDLLRKKAMLLLRREQELHLLRRARQRTDAWLLAFHRLSADPSSPITMSAEWVEVMIRELRFQTAAIYRYDPSTGALDVVAAKSGAGGHRPLTLDEPARRFLLGNPDGRHNAPELETRPAQSATSRALRSQLLAGPLKLARFCWLLADAGPVPHLFVAGYDAPSARYQTELTEEELGCFRMLGVHVSTQQSNVQLITQLERERKELAQSLSTLRETQERLVQASKMAAVGQLAAGVSHEINNPLAVILGYAQGIERRLEPERDGLRTPIAAIVREALRCRDLVQDLLTFSRVAKRTMELVDVRTVLTRAGPLLETRARTQNTALNLELGDADATAHANATQLEQVVINLGNNALDALQRGGAVTLKLDDHATHGLVLEVKDDGPGIPPEVRARIFEPFFTTKDVGKGTGLGLSLVYEIVQQHGGTIEVDTQVGRGTAMRVQLPRPNALHFGAPHSPR